MQIERLTGAAKTWRMKQQEKVGEGLLAGIGAKMLESNLGFNGVENWCNRRTPALQVLCFLLCVFVIRLRCQVLISSEFRNGD